MSDATIVTLKTARRRHRRLCARVAGTAVCVLVIAAFAFSWRFHRRMEASLPQLDGAAPLAGLSADVTVTRDALGVPAINAATRPDAARTLGFLHAQDRFFQMDLTRRRAAGELSALFGKKTLAADKAVRIHGLRAIAQKSLALLPAPQRALLDAYAAGVNTGLAQLREAPFEYLLLGEKPRPWLPEDSILVIHAMALDLQHSGIAHERMLGAIRDCYDNNVLAYFAPPMSPDDSPFDGKTAALPPIPKPSAINLRAGAPADASAQSARAPRLAPPVYAEGSNSMAVAGKHGPGIIENDMHLTLRVPGAWYRVSMQWRAPDAAPAPGDARSPDQSATRNPSGRQPQSAKSKIKITGITHPGAPVIIAGSNGKIVWGFTNAYADTSDVVVVTPDPAGPGYYYANHDILHTETRTEHITVRGEKNPVALEVETCIWGPIIGKNIKGQKLALKWVFHDPAAANYDLAGLETADTVPGAIAIANRAGIPAQNMLVTDTMGDIGWTICGRLPDRFGYDGRAPATWSYGDRGWRGLLPPDDVPRKILSSGARLSTANQRLAGNSPGNQGLATLGDGGYRPGARGARIQTLLDNLPADREPEPRDLLAIALDDYAPHLARWHKLLRNTLAAAKSKKLATLRAAAGETWDEAVPGAHATADSAAYAIVRQFREYVIARVLAPVFEPCAGVYPEFNYNRLRVEEPVWNLILEKPTHLLAPEYASWDDLLLAAAEDARRDLAAAGFPNPANARWGAFNIAHIRHPLSDGALGLVGRLLNLDMPAQQLPGGDDMPRVQRPSHGASMRMIVSPGAEERGIFEMPCGQSGHPLSVYYRAGHEAWTRGAPAPFLPGPAEHTLVLKRKP